MNETWIVVATFASTTLLMGAGLVVAHEAVLKYRWAVAERLNELARPNPQLKPVHLVDFKQLESAASLTGRDWRTRLKDAIAQSGIRATARDIELASCGLAAIFAAALWVLSGRWWLMPLGAIHGLATPFMYIQWLRRRRITQLCWQMPDAFEVMGRAVGAGQTVAAAMQIVADDMEAPISNEFRRCYEQQNLGMSYESVMRELARRTGVMEMRILVVGLLVQSRSGGDIVSLLNNLARTVRNRIKFRQKVKALTGEGRMQAAVLLVLPVLAFFSLLVLSPEYAAILLNRPKLLAATVIAQCLGVWWIRRIVNFDI